MPLRDAVLPRMAGQLLFMRSAAATLDDVLPGQIVAFGAPIGAGLEDAASGPLALRETSSYFGSHFASNMKFAMDVDLRRRLDIRRVSGRIVDIGDIDFCRSANDPFHCIASITSALRRREAVPLMLGGARNLVASVRQGLESSAGGTVALVTLDPASDPLDNQPMLVVLETQAIASHWHGASPQAHPTGRFLSDIRRRFRELGRRNLAGIVISGLEPGRAGLSTVKTAQRLLVTAALELIYAHLDALLPEDTGHG